MHSRNTLILATSILCAACASDRTREPADPSEFELNVAQNEAIAEPNDIEQDNRGASDAQRAHEPGLSTSQQQTPLSAKLRERSEPEVRPDSDEQAHAAFTSATGYDLRGQAEFTQVARGVEVRVAVNGAPPGAKGVHIHQKADCSDIDNKSMGSHFVPSKYDRGYSTEQEHHLGDLGNIEIGADGAGELKIVIPAANLKDADDHSFLARSIVVHEQSDQGTSESGDSGKPIACGIIDR